MTNIFNAYVFNITTKVIYKNKSFDGSYWLDLKVKTYTNGRPNYETLHIERDCMGNLSIINLE